VSKKNQKKNDTQKVLTGNGRTNAQQIAQKIKKSASIVTHLTFGKDSDVSHAATVKGGGP